MMSRTLVYIEYMSQLPPDLHDYANFRIYLRDIFAWQRKQKNPEFLQRNLLERLGVSSSGFLSNLLAGRKNLTPSQIRRMAELLALTEPDALFFDAMVHYGQAKDAEEKNEWFERMTRLQTVHLRPLEAEKLSLFSRAEMVFLYELLTFTKIDGDLSKLGGRFNPPLTSDQVREALRALHKLGLVVYDRKGNLQASDPAVSSGQDVASADLVRFHKRTMALARRSLRAIPVSERDLSVLTLGLSQDGFLQIRSELANFRRKLVSIAMAENHPTRLYQMNFHVFPVTDSLEETT